MTIEEKYQIKYFNSRRYYKFDLTTKVPVLENTVPYYFKHGEFEAYESAWNRMAILILTYLDSKNPKSENDLLSLKYPWSGKNIFSKESRINFTPFKNIFLNTNHHSTHSMMSIQDILRIYDVDPNSCEFFISRHPSAEPEEARVYFRDKTIKSFIKTLEFKKKSKKTISTIISNITIINKKLAELSPGFDDFFLFDDYTYFQNYKKKTLDEVKKTLFNKPEIQDSVKRALDYLDDYYRNARFYETLQKTNIDNNFAKSLELEISKLFQTLNPKVLSSSKLFSRMNLLYNNEMEKLGSLNTKAGVYKITSLLLSNTYFFKEPFIFLENKTDLTNDDIIIEYLFSKDEFTNSEINIFIEKMHLRKSNDLLTIIEACSEEYVQISSSKFIRKYILDLPEEFIKSLEKELSFYLKSFGSLDSTRYSGYDSLPRIHLD